MVVIDECCDMTLVSSLLDPSRMARGVAFGPMYVTAFKQTQSEFLANSSTPSFVNRS